MTRKNRDDMMYGTKIYNRKTKEIGLLIYTWTNTFADGDIPYAKCVDINGKSYDTPMDNILPIEDMTDEELKELGLK